MAASADVLVVGPAGRERDLLVSTLSQTGLSVLALLEAEALGRRDLAVPRLLVLAVGGARSEREATQVRLLSQPVLHGAPLLVVASETDVESYGGALARGAAAYLGSDASPAELGGLALRLARSGPRRREARGPVVGSERRRTRRPLLLKADLEDRARGVRLAGHVVDVGLSGCRLEVAEPVARGTPVGIQLHAYRESTGIVLGGSVRWTRPERDMHLVAVRFNGTSSVVARRLFGLR